MITLYDHFKNINVEMDESSLYIIECLNIDKFLDSGEMLFSLTVMTSKGRFRFRLDSENIEKMLSIENLKKVLLDFMKDDAASLRGWFPDYVRIIGIFEKYLSPTDKLYLEL